MSSVKEVLRDYFPDGIHSATDSKLSCLIGLIDDNVIDQLIKKNQKYIKDKDNKKNKMEITRHDINLF